MKRVLSCLLIFALLGCGVLAFASCTIKFTPSKSTDATTAAPGTTDPSALTDAGTRTDGAETDPAGTEAQPTEPAQTTAPETTAPEGEGEMPVAEDPDNNFGPLHPFN